MSRIRIDFLNWRPDQDEFNTDGLQVADNLLHDTEGYKQVTGPNTATPLGTTSIEAVWVQSDPLGGLENATVNEDWLTAAHWQEPSFTVNSVVIGTWGTFSEYVATAPAGATQPGVMESFSSLELENTIVATSKFYFASSLPTATTIASGYISYSLDYGIGSTWTDLPNGASGIICGKINNFAMVGNDGTGNPGNFTVRWSAIGDATSWPTPNTDAARAVQSGSEVLDGENGEVTAIAGGDFYGYIFQKNAITKATYVGGDIVFSFDDFEENRGCGFYNRIVKVNDAVFFESDNGRHVVENDQVFDIGYGIVDDAYPVSTTQGDRIYHNPAIKMVFFTNNVAYNYKTKQWTRVSGITPACSIDDKNNIIGQFRNASGVSTLLLGSSGGANLSATLTTGDSDLNEGGHTYVNGVRPLVDGGTWSVRVGTRDDLSTSISWSTSTSVTTRTGYHDFREDGRYQRFELTNSDGFNTLMGADLDVEPSGEL